MILKNLYVQELKYIEDTAYLVIQIKAKKKHTNTVLKLLYESIAPTHKEDACLEYKILQNKTSIIVSGKWKNKMSLDMHLLFQYHLALFEETLTPLCKKIHIKTYEEIEPPITALSVS